MVVYLHLGSCIAASGSEPSNGVSNIFDRSPLEIAPLFSAATIERSNTTGGKVVLEFTAKNRSTRKVGLRRPDDSSDPTFIPDMWIFDNSEGQMNWYFPAKPPPPEYESGGYKLTIIEVGGGVTLKAEVPVSILKAAMNKKLVFGFVCFVEGGRVMAVSSPIVLSELK